MTVNPVSLAIEPFSLKHVQVVGANQQAQMFRVDSIFWGGGQHDVLLRKTTKGNEDNNNNVISLESTFKTNIYTKMLYNNTNIIAISSFEGKFIPDLFG